MFDVGLLAIGLWAGADVRRLTLLAAATYVPFVVLLLVALLWWRRRRAPALGAVHFCRSVASELRAGSSPRQAVSEAARVVGASAIAEAAESGASFASVAAAAATQFPAIGPELGACLERSAWSGAPAADLFEEVSGLALAQDEVAREVTTALGPARATLMILLAAPAFGLWWVTSHGQLGDYLSSPAQRLVVLAGLGLCAAGMVFGLAMVRRAR